MGIKAGPKIVKDGLVFDIDAAVSRSYSGSGLTAFGLVSGIGGTLVNGAGYGSTNNGFFTFDGTNDFFVSSNLDLSNTNVATISIWTKIENYRETANNSNCLIEFTNNYNNSTGGFNISFGDDSSVSFGGVFPITLAVKGNTGYNFATYSKSLVNDLKWHKWDCVLDKGQSGIEVSLYIDSILVSPLLTSISNNTNNFTSTNLYIANRAFSNVSVSNLKVYNRALSAQEILQNYNATKGRYR